MRMFWNLISGPTKGDLSAWYLAYFHGIKVLSGVLYLTVYVLLIYS